MMILCLCVLHVNPTCDDVCELLVVDLPQQPDQGRNSITVLNGYFIVCIFAIRNVL